MTTKQLEAAKVDEFVDLDTELLPFKSKISRRDRLRKEIAARYDDHEPDGTFIAPGSRTDGVTVGPRTLRRDFKPGAMKRLMTFLGDTFFKLAKVSMEDFDDHVTIDKRDQYVVQSQTGYRYVNVIRTDVEKVA